MPVLESEEKIAPKSILRHRPIGESHPSTGRRTIITDATAPASPTVPRASRTRKVEPLEDVVEWRQEDEESETKPAQRTPSRPPIRRAGTRTQAYSRSRPLLHPKTTLTSQRLWPQVHPLFYLGVGMVSMLVLWILLSTVFGWFTTTLNDLHYGRPRTFQVDAWVGHNEQNSVPTHFIAINLKGRIEIIEMPGGDPSRSRIYVGPQLYGPNSDLVPVTLSFRDVNGDHKPDMIVTFQDNHVIFINDQGGFHQAQSPDHR